jgi:hypothetical protein
LFAYTVSSYPPFSAYENHLKTKLDTLEHLLGKDHDTVLETARELGMVLVDQGRYSEAEHLRRRSVIGTDKYRDEDDVRTILALRCRESLGTRSGSDRGEVEGTRRGASSNDY